MAVRRLSDLTWLRVGGPAERFWQPRDIADLAAGLAAHDPGEPVLPMGVGSNLIVRDGGVRGTVIRLGRGFQGIEIKGDLVTAGAAALDAHVARRAAAAGLDLGFLRTIPGSIGGAVRMNAGCYGAYIADIFVSAEVVTRAGQVRTLDARDLAFAYRETALPPDWVITRAVFRANTRAEPADLEAKMADQIARRDATQPTGVRTAGSTFRNPSGASSTGVEGEDHSLKAWKLIEQAGMKGERHGGAQMSEKHANFLVNTGGATAADLEELGEAVRKRVFQTSGITLHWEVQRIGEPA